MSIVPIRDCIPQQSGEPVTEALPGLAHTVSPLLAHGVKFLSPLALSPHCCILLSVMVLLRFSVPTGFRRSSLGKHGDQDVYKVDLSTIVSKYIGETEKNLERFLIWPNTRNGFSS